MMSTAAATSTLDTILGYAARGWPVFPLYGISNGVCGCRKGAACKESSGKHPIPSNGFYAAVTDPELISAWFKRYPGCNWAIRTGEPLPQGGYLVVLDVDPRNGGDETLGRLEREHGELPRTVTAISGGNGAHYLFEASAPINGFDLDDGIEFKASGGYIVVAPSLHYSGRHYAWDAARHPDDTPIAKLPAWPTDRPAPRARPETGGVDALNSLLGEAFRVAGLLRDVLPQGRRIVVCPWADEHSDSRGHGDDSSTVILPPSLTSNFGGFKCLHGHCQSRGWKDVFAKLPPAAIAAGRAKYAVRPAPPAPPSEPPAAGPPSDREPEPDDWKLRLVYKQSAKGVLKLHEASANVVTILSNDPRWKGKIRFDQFAQKIRVTNPPWESDDAPTERVDEWRDEDDGRAQAWLLRQNEYQLNVGIATVMMAVAMVAHANAYHEVREYLDSLVWDGVPRVDRFFVTYFGADDTDYTRAVGSRWLISAVARIYRPGCQADCAPVLEGAQGDGKSTALEALASAKWFSDSSIAIGSADGYAGLRGKWIIELAELEAFRGRSVSAIKQYISARFDHYRASYGHHHATHPRQCVFSGSTNEDEYFVDTSGNRRFWPIECHGIDVAAVRRDRDQLWAEAVSMFRGGQPWHIDTPDLRKLCEGEQSERMVSDAWEEPVRRWLAGHDARVGVLTHDVLTGALGVEPGNFGKSDEQRVAAVLRRLGYAKQKNTRKEKQDDGRVVRTRRWFQTQ